MMRCRTIGSRIISSQIMSLLHQDRRVLAIVRWSGWMTVHSPPRTRHTHNTTHTRTTTPPRSGRRFRSLHIQSESRLIRPRLGDQHLLLRPCRRQPTHRVQARCPLTHHLHNIRHIKTPHTRAHRRARPPETHSVRGHNAHRGPPCTKQRIVPKPKPFHRARRTQRMFRTQTRTVTQACWPSTGGIFK